MLKRAADNHHPQEPYGGGHRKESREEDGIGVQIMTPDGTGFAPNYMKLKDVPDIPGKG